MKELCMKIYIDVVIQKYIYIKNECMEALLWCIGGHVTL
jgi:hypothetical protein